MKFLKILLFIFLTLIIVVLGGLSYVKFMKPNIAVQEIDVEITPERVERGEYLANHIMVCMDCHSVRDWSLYSGPITPGTFGSGGDAFTREMGFPGDFYAPNITPYSLKDWTDGEIYRAITSGVKKNGDPIFPIMPYLSYGQADTEDIYSIIAYIRSLEPHVKDVPAADPDFPFSLIMHIIPKEAEPSQKPKENNQIEYGKYLVDIAACADCHTPFEKGQSLMEMKFAGGREFELPFGTLRAPNITPHKVNGIGMWTEDMFIKRFQSYDSVSKLKNINGMNEFNTLMPWNMYGSMKTSDLKAIYKYLHSLDPINNEVQKVTFK